MARKNIIENLHKIDAFNLARALSGKDLPIKPLKQDFEDFDIDNLQDFLKGMV